MRLTPRITEWTLALVVVLAATNADAGKVACPPGRYMMPGVALLSGSSAPANDDLYIREVNGILVASLGSGRCPLAAAKMKAKRRFTKVSAKFRGCLDAPGIVIIKAKIAAPDCDTMTGRVRATGAPLKSDRNKTFTGVKAPSLAAPDGTVVGALGGTYTNPLDASSVTVSPGAFLGQQSATVGAASVSTDDLLQIQQLLGLTLPSGLDLLTQFQVFLGQNDPTPRNSLTASVPEDGEAGDGTLVQALLEPSFVAGASDTRTAKVVYGGEVTQAGGRYEMQVSPQHFGSPPGLSFVMEIPAATPTCFISGVVQDSNGSPVPYAMIGVSSLPGLLARANAVGFYRAVVTQGTNSVTATADDDTGSTDVICDVESSPRVTDVNLVVDVSPSTSVPVVEITDPATNETIAATYRTIDGTVSDSSIETVTIATHIGDLADTFTQTAPVENGAFSATVILSAGRSNTVVVLATNDSGITGADSVIITVTGTEGEDLRFTMTWDTDTTDVDLHVRLPGANGIPDTVDGDTIYYVNRSAGSGTLDVDDTDGFGPENIVFPLGTAQAGTYAVAAHYWRGAPIDTWVTVSVFVGGTLKGSFTQLLTTSHAGAPLNSRNPESVFNIATVTIPGGAIGSPADQSVFIDGPE